MDILLVEDNARLRAALAAGMEAAGVQVRFACASGEQALAFCQEQVEVNSEATGKGLPHAALIDVHLAGEMNGIQATIALRREFPRFPVVFYSIQDDDQYYRDFRRSGILSHYAYVRKSNYLLPEMILPLLRQAVAGGGFIDPEIEARVEAVRQQDEHNPLSLLEPHERAVAELLAKGLTNEQIAARLGYQDKRTISRVNGQIYLTWGLANSTTDEKVARTRAALIVQSGRLWAWDEDGNPQALDAHEP